MNVDSGNHICLSGDLLHFIRVIREASVTQEAIVILNYECSYTIIFHFCALIEAMLMNDLCINQELYGKQEIGHRLS